MNWAPLTYVYENFSIIIEWMYNELQLATLYKALYARPTRSDVDQPLDAHYKVYNFKWPERHTIFILGGDAPPKKIIIFHH